MLGSSFCVSQYRPLLVLHLYTCMYFLSPVNVSHSWSAGLKYTLPWDWAGDDHMLLWSTDTNVWFCWFTWTEVPFPGTSADRSEAFNILKTHCRRKEKTLRSTVDTKKRQLHHKNAKKHQKSIRYCTDSLLNRTIITQLQLFLCFQPFYNFDWLTVGETFKITIKITQFLWICCDICFFVRLVLKILPDITYLTGSLQEGRDQQTIWSFKTHGTCNVNEG